MSYFDAVSLYHIVDCLPPVVKDETVTEPTPPVTSATVDSTMVDRGTAKSVMFLVHWASGDSAESLTFTLKEGDTATFASATTVAATDIISQPDAIADLSATTTGVVKIGYRGTKRYVGIQMSRAGTCGNLVIGGVCVLGDAGRNPTV